MSEQHHDHSHGDHSHSHGDHSHGEHSHSHGGDAHGHADDAAAHFRSYIAIFIALCVFTAISFVFNELVRGGIISPMTSATVIMIVAIIKAGCVAYIFMHLKADWGKVYCIMIPVVIMCVMMIIVFLPDGVLGWR
ncbi:MAG: cytochrome C oxidase subunit IV family protein [Gemmataceae bacterium]|nr:cytochrome C oxidase subunit IV family protein [Gemmataceae bacterium]